MLEHDPWLVLLAGLMCVAGAYVTVKLWRRSLTDEARARFYWCFLSSVTTGAFVWATHFIAMLGYHPGVSISLDGSLTIASALVVIAGSGIGLSLASLPDRHVGDVTGGAVIGLSIASMHYLGSLAYHVEGVARWDIGYVVASALAAILFSILAMHAARSPRFDAQPWRATGWLAGAVLALHFLGMAAVTIVPLKGVSIITDGRAIGTLAMASALVTVLIVGMGISIHLLERRWRESSAETLRYIARHDELTDLPNRRRFNEVLAARSTAGGLPFALLVVDLDRFKPINDNYGHAVGDLVLIEIARRLRMVAANALHLARLGGDEFAVLIDCRDAQSGEPELLAAALIAAITQPMAIEDKRLQVDASIGIGRAVPGETRPAELAQQADIALYEAKQRGRDRFVSFAPDLMRALRARRDLEADLQAAVANHAFEVVYQPVTDRDGHYCGAEALVRWERPGVGPVSPAEFIPMAEQLGLISEIGRFVLIEAARTAAKWPAHIGVAVNLSPIQLREPDLPDQVERILAEAGLAPERLELEITETGIVGDDVLALRSLRLLAAMGVTIALDDFGTGYSSLGHLHLLPIDRLKIDRSFTDRVPADDISAAIVNTCTALATKLNLEITAEGIETDAQRRFMLETGCTHLQGYMLGRPMRAHDVARVFAGGAPVTTEATASDQRSAA